MRRTLEGQIFRCCRWSFFLGLCGPATVKTCWKLSLINEHTILVVVMPTLYSCSVGLISELILAPVWASSLTSSLVPVWAGLPSCGGGVRTFPASLVLFACRESPLSPSVTFIMLWQPVSLFLSPVLKRQIKSILFYFVMFRKWFHKQRVCWKTGASCLTLSRTGTFLKGIAINGNELTKANLL